MEDRETPQMLKYGESKTTRIMIATVSHVTSGSGLWKFQADGFLFDRAYHMIHEFGVVYLPSVSVIRLDVYYIAFYIYAYIYFSV